MKWEAKAITHHKQKRIAVWFPKTAEAIPSKQGLSQETLPAHLQNLDSNYIF